MPRRNLPTSTRFQVDPRNSHDYTTPALHVSAYPVDPHVQTVASPGLSQLVSALSSVNRGLQAYAGYSQRLYAERFGEGELAALKGEERPGSSEALARGWDSMQGKLAARMHYRQAVNEFLNENIETATPDEIEAGLQEIAQGFIEGASDDFLKSFLPIAIGIEEEAALAYQQTQQRRIREQTLDMIRQTTFDEINDIIVPILRRAYNIQGPEDIVGNLSIYEGLQTGDFGFLFAKEIRKHLSEVQKDAKELGIHRNHVSEIYVDVIGRMAINLGLPELMAFADEKDESGFVLSKGQMAERIQSYKEAAQDARSEYLRAEERKRAELEAAAQNQLLNEFHHDIRLLAMDTDHVRRAQAAQELRHRLREDPAYLSLPNTDYRRLVDMLFDLESSQYSLPDTSNDAVFLELYRDGIDGVINIEDINAAVAARQLTRADAEKLYSLEQAARDREQREIDSAQAAVDARNKEAVNNAKRAAAMAVTKMNELGMLLNPEAAANFELQMLLREDQFLRANDWRQPTLQEAIEHIIDPALHSVAGTSWEKITDARMFRPETPTFARPESQWVPQEEEKLNLIQRTWRGVTNTFKSYALAGARRVGLNWFDRWDQQRPAGWLWTARDSYDRIVDAFSSINPQTDEPYTKAEVESFLKSLTRSDGTPVDDLEVQAYLDHYASTTVATILEFPHLAILPDGTMHDAVQYARDLLRSQGFSSDEILRAFRTAGFETPEGFGEVYPR